jgi:O-antigen/teichoic acid export membrane protein
MTAASSAQVTPGRSAPPSENRLIKRALSLGAAGAIDYGLQFLLPVVLTRCLDADAFGQYRVLWLAAGTVLAVITASVPGSLYYYLPRSNAEDKRLYINQALLFLALAGALAAWAVSPGNPLLPDMLKGLPPGAAILPSFVFLWVVSWLLDSLPAAEERVSWQARATVVLSALRAVALSLTAWLTGELGPVLVVLVAFVAIKVAVLLFYIARYHGLRGPVARKSAFADQLHHAGLFSVASTLYGLQAQADQWIAAAMFSMAMFASFSVAAVLAPLINLCRQSMNYAFLPAMSRCHSEGDIQGMVALNRRANVIVGTLVYPLLAFAFVFTEEIVTLVYTATYVEAAPVMRIYILGMAAIAIETGTVTLQLRQGRHQLVMSACLLALSIPLSYFGALQFGLPGAALGSVTAMYLDRYFTLRMMAGKTDVPIRRLQDWRSIGLWVLFGAISALCALAVVTVCLPHAGAFARLALAGACMAVVYAALQVSFGLGRAQLTAILTRKDSLLCD